MTVSIHAPVWGATGMRGAEAGSGCFNPRARVGRDLESRRSRAVAEFQSTRPCGARLSIVFLFCQ